jgi:hypothetical protein
MALFILTWVRDRQVPAKGEEGGAHVKEAFDTCYNKCVAQETKDVAQERLKVCTLCCALLPLSCLANTPSLSPSSLLPLSCSWLATLDIPPTPGALLAALLVHSP